MTIKEFLESNEPLAIHFTAEEYNSLSSKVSNVTLSYLKVMSAIESQTKKENKMKTEKILNLWKGKKLNAIETQFGEKIRDVRDKDEFTVLIKEYESKVKELAGKYNISLGFMPAYTNTPETQKQISLLQNEQSQAGTDLRILCKEIETQLSACESYEQEISILKLYEVLDNDGKINA